MSTVHRVQKHNPFFDGIMPGQAQRDGDANIKDITSSRGDSYKTASVKNFKPKFHESSPHGFMSSYQWPINRDTMSFLVPEREHKDDQGQRKPLDYKPLIKGNGLKVIPKLEKIDGPKYKYLLYNNHDEENTSQKEEITAICSALELADYQEQLLQTNKPGIQAKESVIAQTKYFPYSSEDDSSLFDDI